MRGIRGDAAQLGLQAGDEVFKRAGEKGRWQVTHVNELDFISWLQAGLETPTALAILSMIKPYSRSYIDIKPYWTILAFLSLLGR